MVQLGCIFRLTLDLRLQLLNPRLLLGELPVELRHTVCSVEDALASSGGVVLAERRPRFVSLLVGGLDALGLCGVGSKGGRQEVG